MSDRARTLRFAVTTSLLAMPALAGCKEVHTNPGPQAPTTDAPEPMPATTTPDGETPPDETPTDTTPTGETPTGETPTETTPPPDTTPPADKKPPRVVVNPGPQRPPSEPKPKP